MNIFRYSLCVFLSLFIAECFSNVPLPIQRRPEHRLSIRSTPSLDPAEELLEKFGTDYEMNFTQIEELLKSIGVSGWNDTNTGGRNAKGEQTCFSSQYFYGMYSKNDGNINKTDLVDLCPALLYQLSKKECQKSRKDKIISKHEGKEDPARAWGYGFIFVTVISLSSLLGACVVPLMHKKFYQKILMSMVSLAVGVLGGSGVFHLIPSALGFPKEDEDYSYLWKCAMVVGGLYLFFVLESVMKMYIQFKSIGNKSDSNVSVDLEEKPEVDCKGVDIQRSDNVYANNGHGHSHNGGTELYFVSPATKAETNGGSEPHSIVVSKSSEKKKIATVAWMIIIGDGLHNFIDGLAIGASFSSSVISGISTSLAVISEELPHELGDFAILLNSGFTYKQAMAANFLSACTCYVGLAIGLVLGYATSSVKYIYGIAGGMFLYISLVDMLPEAVQMAKSLSGNSKSTSIKMMLIQNFAIVFGFSVMLLLAFLAPSIEV